MVLIVPMGDTTMATVGEFIAERLQAWGIERIYGYPGDGITGITTGLRKLGAPRFIQAQHEELSAFMACAHAKFTGEVGVCLATSGPGAIHLLNGLYDAKMDHQPVVAIIGQSATTALGSSYQQEVDLASLFKDVASEYVRTVTSAAAVQHVIDRAIRIALDQRSVTCVIVPKDIQDEEIVEPSQKHDFTFTSIGYAEPVMVPARAQLEQAAEILNAGKKVAVLVGQGARNATDEVLAVTDMLGGGVAKAWLGKSVIPDDVPFCTDTIGLLGTKPSWDMMQECDTLLIVGSSFPYLEFYPPLGKARAVQIDADGRMLALRYPVDVALKGDARDTLRALLPLLVRKNERSWQQGIIMGMRDWRELCMRRAMDEVEPGRVNPERVFHELSPQLPENCILAADSGSAANWYARDLQMRRGMMASGSGNLATMGCAVPYAIAAKMTHPDRVAIALAGDGAMQMTGINALITISKYWKEWSDPRLVTLVLNNSDLNMVTWEQRVMGGDAKFEASQNLPQMNYAAYAEMLGLKGIRVDRADAIADAWREALSADRPVVIDALTSADVPTLPPHITVQQAKNFALSILKGDVNRGGIIKQAVRAAADVFTSR